MANYSLSRVLLLTFLVNVNCLLIIAQSEGSRSVSNKLSSRATGLKQKRVQEADLLYNWLLFPEYHGYEANGDDMWNDPFVPQRDCKHEVGNISAGAHGTVRSPNYPDNYPPGLRCEWTIESAPGTKIRATFFDMVTQPWFFFYYDYLLVSLDGSWKQFYRFTGDMNRLAPISIESKENKLAIRFASSFDFFNYRGFKMAYVVRNAEPVSEIAPAVAGSAENEFDQPNSTQILQNGNGNDLSAICDYVPITLPPESSGDIPLKKVTDDKLSRIVGGVDAFPNEYPFMVALVLDDEYFCGGSLIDERHVLTAAHCTDNTIKMELYFGVHDMTANEDTRQYQVVSSDNFFQHPKYNKYTAANDIAIVRLNERIIPNAYVQPIYLPSVYSLGNSFSGWKLTTMGWGDTNKTTEEGAAAINPILKKSTATVIPIEECRKSYRNLVTGNFICSKGSLTDSPCSGDSGGPLVAKFVRKENIANDVPAQETENGQVHQCVFSKSHRNRVKQEKVQSGSELSEWYVQLGVLSFGSRTCGSGLPAAFTRVTAYLDFITPVIGDHYRKVGDSKASTTA